MFQYWLVVFLHFCIFAPFMDSLLYKEFTEQLCALKPPPLGRWRSTSSASSVSESSWYFYFPRSFFYLYENESEFHNNFYVFSNPGILSRFKSDFWRRKKLGSGFGFPKGSDPGWTSGSEIHIKCYWSGDLWFARLNNMYLCPSLCPLVSWSVRWLSSLYPLLNRKKLFSYQYKM